MSLIIKDEQIKTIIGNGLFGDLLTLLYDGVETDGEGAVYEDDDLYDALDEIGGIKLDVNMNSYPDAILSFADTKWSVQMENRVNRFDTTLIRETVLYFDRIKEIK